MQNLKLREENKMKQLFTLALLISTCAVQAQQMPYFPLDNYAPTFGTQTITAPFGMVTPTSISTPVNISQTAQVDFVAGMRLALHPGFSAGAFSGNGYFHGQIGNVPDFEVAFLTPNQNTPFVGQFEKLEMGLTLPAVVEQQVNDFINNGSGGLNPFDPDQISVEAVFTNGFISIKQYGFYYQEFHRDLSDLQGPAVWVNDPTPYHWLIRMSPPNTGIWHCTINIYLNGASIPDYSVQNIFFNCVPSSNPGFLEVGQDNRHLRFSKTQQSFFAIGQNIAWPYHESWRGVHPFPDYPPLFETGFLDIYEYIQNLADNGGNFLHIISTPTGWEIEWGNSPGVYRMEKAWELDRLFELCEQNGIYIEFNPDWQGKYNASSGTSGWNSNPYNLIPGVSTPPDLYGTAALQTTEKYLKQRMRYIFARWGYSTNLGILQFFSEQDGWDGHDDEDLQNDASKQLGMEVIQDDLATYFQQWYFASKHLLSSSYAQHPYLFHDHNVFDGAGIDITSINDYGLSKGVSKEYYDNFNNGNIGNRQGNFTLWNKPCIQSEMGINSSGGKDINGDPIADPDDISFCDDVEFHNAIWSTSFSGSLGCGLNWWQWNNNDFRAQNFPAIKDFFNDQDFEGLNWTNAGHWADFSASFSNYYKHVKIETFYLASGSNDHVMGWAHNATNYWGNIVQATCTDRRGYIMPLPDDDDDQWSSPQSINGADVGRVEAMNYGRYSVQRYNTRGSGGILGASYQKWTDIFGRLEINWYAQVPDFAFRADLDPLFHRAAKDSLIITELNPDTLSICQSDTLTAKGTFLFDNAESYSYKWYLNNTLYSEQVHPVFYFNNLGMYVIKVDIYDSSGQIASFAQEVSVVDCGESNNERFGASENYGTSNPKINVYPNPAINILYIDLSESENQIANIFSVNGKLIMRIRLQQQNEIDISDLISGIYFLEIENEKQKAIFKVVKID
jgi:hypothetical protein